ncbi:putative flavoprotein involved in K+ transport [Agromyces ramosus]|uniref:Putative flavoprotein involved in K+ transport n=1 Tax=Agromyces ramosus TaxID=33879 RepID=A0A4Q7M930_9MICO|nr:NAD(P)/FAD-dependent oxidoreductase [Agromyces ramosus]RZS64324.1 putative flavoprotein involved in K+ transport [Agromyces ramosus]
MRADVDVLVVGGGQAGLAVSHGLAASGVDHVVLERDRLGSAWDGRWDSFRLVTPNHTIRLPGGEYRGDEPDGFLARDEIAEHLRRYAASFGAPVVEGTRVDALRADDGGFTAETAAGRLRARRVVVCTGAYQRAHRPAFVADLERELPVVAATEYRSPASIPDGRVLVIGGGQTGCQLAEELVRAGREVVLAASRAPAMPRRVDGRDTVDWLEDAGFFEHTLSDMPSPAVRFVSNPLATGADGGHDLDLRTLDARGVQLIGHVLGTDGTDVIAADDLDDCVAVGDQAIRDICTAIERTAAALGRPEPELPPPPASNPVAAPAPRLADLGVAIVACGFRPAYEWIEIPGLVDDMGFPVQEDGASARIRGLHFVGVPWMRTRKSPLLLGVGEDAEVVVGRLAAQ